MEFCVFQIVEFSKFLKFSKWEIFGIFQIVWNCPNWKINKFLDFSIWKTKIWLRKLTILGIIRLFDIPHYGKFGQF